MELVKSEYHVRTMVGEVVSMMDMAASQHGLLMKYEYDTAIPCRYYGDEGRIKQILINLLNNAVKFTDEGYVRIWVGGRPGESEGEELLVFQVEDTGCGIRKEDQSAIFENFRQINSQKSRSVEGTGLGLSITKRLVDLMGGKIALESVYGKGTTFTVTIPQRIVDKRSLVEVPEDLAEKEEKTETFTASGYKVLLVDDNLVNRKVARGFLKPYQFDLTEAAGGREAIELVKSNKFDLIFMDHMMPEIDGIETVHIIREECGENGRSPVIIALTANAMEGIKDKFLSNGFQDFIAKPLERGSLNQILKKWIPVKQDSDGEDEENSLSDIHISGIDTKTAMRYNAGSAEDYVELLRIYSLDGKRKPALLQKLLEEKNFENYEIEVHGLKSASANIGAMQTSSLAREHEEAASRGDYEFVESHFSELLSSYEKQLHYIDDFLDETKKEDGARLLPELDEEGFISGITEALNWLERFHSKECADRIEELLSHHLNQDKAAKLTEIQEQLKMYEDDAAEDLLRKLLEEMKNSDG